MLGCVYALVAVGLSLIFGVMKLVNLAHGGFFMLGAYIVYWLDILYGVNPYIALVPSLILVSLIGLLVMRFCFRPFLYAEPPVLRYKLQLFMSLALMYIFESSAVLLWQEDTRELASPLRFTSVNLGSFSLAGDYVVAITLTAAILALLTLFLKKTMLGRAIVGTSQNMTAALLMGVNVERVYLLTFAVATMMAVAAGVLFGMLVNITPYMGLFPTVMAFSIIILGGMGNLPGALIGAFIMGISQSAAVVYLGGPWKDVVAFIIVIIVLLIRPQGLLGGR
jgi:branched-chain amino acid transport system permease protein